VYRVRGHGPAARKEEEMRRSRWLLPMLVLTLPACAGLGDGPGIRALAGQQLLVGSSDGVLSLDAGTGSVRFQGTGVPALGSWSTVFTTDVSGGASILEARDATTGHLTSSVSVPGELSVRIASPDGGLVALMPPLPDGASPWIPEPRATSRLVVADPSGNRAPAEFELDGNFEPEAFSSDGRHLYMVSFIPPTAPEAYRVARLNIGTGRVQDVNTGVKGVVETMSGTRLEQVAEPDGSMLHTLYTTEPAAYAEHAHQSGQTVSFVHMLSLDAGWAHCLALPKPMWGGDAASQAMALSGDGSRLYVVDTARGVVAEVDTGAPELLRTAHVDFGPTGDAPTQATLSPDGNLFVSTGSRIVTIDTATLQRTGGWTAEQPILGLGSDADHVYIAMSGEIEVLDRSTDRPLGTISSPAVRDVAFIGQSSED
jgi:hypothetical protein